MMKHKSIYCIAVDVLFSVKWMKQVLQNSRVKNLHTTNIICLKVIE